MAGAIARLFVQLGLNKAEFDSGAKSAKDSTFDLAGEMRTATSASGLLEGALKSAGILGLAYLAREAVQAAYDLAMVGAEAARVGTSFTAVARGVGASAEGISAAMDEATGRVVDDEALMQTAAQGMIMGLRLSEGAWADLAAGARYHAKLIGQDTETVFSGIVDSISRGQPRMLQALSFPGARDAINQLSQELDGAAASMTEAERQAALLELVMKTLADEQARFGPLPDDAIDSVDRLKVAWGNLKEEIGEGLTPILITATEDMLRLVDAARQLKDSPIMDLLLLGPKMAGASAQFGSDIGEKIGGMGADMLSELADAMYDLSMAQESLNLALAGGDVIEISAWRAEVERLEALIPELLTKSTEASSARWAALGASFSGTAEAVSGVGDAADDVAGKLGTWDAGFRQAGASANNIWKIIVKIRDDVNNIDFDELESGLQSALGSATSTLAGLAGTVDFSVVEGLYAEAQAQLEALYAEAADPFKDMTEMELAYREQAIMDSLRDTVGMYEDAGEDSAKAFGDAFEDMKSTVAAALQPTSVSALDYLPGREDAWDENARRLDAIAARGGAELVAHPDWESMLMIPPDVMAAGDEALKAWAQQTSDDVRNLFRPDLLTGSLDEMVETVRGYVLDQEAREGTIEDVTAAYQAKYGGSATDAKKMAKLLLGDTSQVGETVADDLAAGMKKSMGQGSLTATLVATWKTDVDNNKKDLQDAGGRIWDVLFGGIRQAVKDQDPSLIQVIAEKVAPAVARILSNNWQGSN